jgi:hypothetical protein
MKLLFDAHCHVLSLARPALGPFLEALNARKGEAFLAQVSSPSYLLFSFLRHGGEAARRMLSVAECDAARVFMLMEDDLAGRFAAGLDDAPEGLEGFEGLRFLGERWDGWFACPLLLDFGRPVEGLPAAYYPSMPRKPIEESAREMLAGIRGYRRERPRGKLLIRPFLGIDPVYRGASATEELLDRYFAGFKKTLPAQLAAFRRAAAWKGDPEKPPRNSFAGVKLYPPLGFDPWPGDSMGRDAVRLLYGYCEARGIPLTVHCDDQGYSTITIERAGQHTDPERWAPILAEFPRLIVNFAHFGERYLLPGWGDSKERWTRCIVGLMERYEGVYADVAFNGCDPEYWARLCAFLDGLSPNALAIVRRRLLYGTDFFINLTKVRSYLDYAQGFAHCCLDRELKRAMVAENPERFFMV